MRRPVGPPVKEHIRQIGRVSAVVLRNRELRRVEISFALFNGAEWAVWIAMLVYAYGKGGATAAGVVSVVQLVPATLFAPLASVLGDRYRPARVLTLGYVAQATGMGATAAVLLLDGPTVLAYACAAVAATAVTITRPTMAALTPALCHRPGRADCCERRRRVEREHERPRRPGNRRRPARRCRARAGCSSSWALRSRSERCSSPASTVPAANPASDTSVRTELVEGFTVVIREPAARTLVGLLGAEQISLGMLDVLYVVLAVGTLGMGNGGAGYLNAAFGAGGALGIGVTASLVGRARLIPALVVSLAVWAASFVVMTVWTTAAGALFLLALAGAAHALFDVAGKTLLQRTAPPEVLARVFGVLEALMMAGLALGSVLAPLLVHLGGARAVILGTGVLLPLLALVVGRRLYALDASADVPIVEIGLLRSLPLFSMLSPPALEGLARSLEPLSAAAGTPIVTQGEEGDRYYAIAEGEVEVIVDGIRVNTIGRGDGFGEIALLHDVTRTATVSALTALKLYTLEKEPFLEVLTGHPAAHAAANAVAKERTAVAS